MRLMEDWVQVEKICSKIWRDFYWSCFSDGDILQTFLFQNYV